MLNVWTTRQAILRLLLPTLIVVWMLGMGVSWIVVGIHPFETGDTDARHMLNDFRQTLGGIQAHHNAYFRSSSGPPVSLSLDGNSIPLSSFSMGKGSLQDPRMGSAGLFSLSNTAYAQTWLANAGISLSFPPFALGAAGQISLLPRSSPQASVYYYATTSLFPTSPASVAVSPLTGLAISIAYLDDSVGWVVVDVVPSYGEAPAWVGPLAEAPTFFSGSVRSVSVVVEDVSMPATRGYPALSGFSLVFAGAALILLSLFAICPMVYILYLTRRNIALNHNRPPPFFGSLRKFRGWG